MLLLRCNVWQVYLNFILLTSMLTRNSVFSGTRIIGVSEASLGSSTSTLYSIYLGDLKRKSKIFFINLCDLEQYQHGKIVKLQFWMIDFSQNGSNYQINYWLMHYNILGDYNEHNFPSLVTLKLIWLVLCILTILSNLKKQRRTATSIKCCNSINDRNLRFIKKKQK